MEHLAQRRLELGRYVSEMTILQRAVYVQNLPMVKRGLRRESANTRYDQRLGEMTVLAYSITLIGTRRQQGCTFEIIKLLLRAGANPNDDTINLFLPHAEEQTRRVYILRLVDMLHKQGLHLEQRYPLDLILPNSRGMTLLELGHAWACQGDHLLLQAVLARGANPFPLYFQLESFQRDIDEDEGVVFRPYRDRHGLQGACEQRVRRADELEPLRHGPGSLPPEMREVVFVVAARIDRETLRRWKDLQ